ncbi:conserved membrane hypothetical protein [Burkholderiales bacterium 8X]|nr:conserved membrane hypothetical protein [Burkholderiales bacterium 8X]
MDSVSISTMSSLLAMFASLSAVLVLGFVGLRTRSMHLPMYRLWRFFHGNDVVSDFEIQRLVASATNLMHFRSMYGIRVDTLAQCHRLIAWARMHEVEMPAVAACGELFDPIHCQLRERLPTVGRRLALAVSTLLAIALFSAAVMALFSQTALVRFTSASEQRYFLLGSDAARPLWSMSPSASRLQGPDCGKPLAAAGPQAASGFTPEERNILCKVFEDQAQLMATIDQALFAQRWLLAGCALLLIFFLKMSTTALRSIAAAEDLQRHLTRRLLFVNASDAVSSASSASTSGASSLRRTC